MSKYILAFLLLVIFYFPGHTQKVKEDQKRPLKKLNHKKQFLQGTVIFKVKPEYRKAFEYNEKGQIFGSLHNEVGITSIKRMFPKHSTPDKKTNHLGQPLVDLSLTYIVRFNSEISVDEVVDRILKTGMVTYAEPYYTDQLLYVPNDPIADTNAATLGGQAYYLKNMQYYEALDISKGDTNVVIGIIDTGTKLDHEDLKNSIKYNYADPINGADDDHDGYVDNFYGWDFGMSDNNPTATGDYHGTFVSGCSSASTDNGLGVVGTGFKCKFLPIKASTDDPHSAILYGYDGVIYAADHGCSVINLSWGGAGEYSSAAQDVINYAAINKDAVVVAAAGNSGLEEDFYPASYDNVLAVGSTVGIYNAGLDSMVEVKSDLSTYGYHVDIVAQGRKVFSTNNTSYEGGGTGSSFSSPIVAGAAGLIRAKYPSLKGVQVAELLRMNADPLIDTISWNLAYKQEKLGRGRVNIYKALTDHTSPSIRLVDRKITNDFGPYAFAGDTIKIQCKFSNYLQPTINTTATMTITSGHATVINGSFNIGALNTMDTINNSASPFKVYIDPSAPSDETLVFRIGYSDPAKGYEDFQYFKVIVNPSYLSIDTNKVALTVTSNGRFAYLDPYYAIGGGFVYNTKQMVYESGLMIGTSSTKVSDCVRGADGTPDDDFTVIKNQKYVKLPEGDQGAVGFFTDKDIIDSIGVKVEQRSYEFAKSPDDKYLIVEYQVQNISGHKLDSVFVGIFTDWDIQNPNANKCNWSSLDSIGYTYYPATGGLYGGVCLLTNNVPGCFSMDHKNLTGNINPNDGFTTVEKYNTLSNKIARATAGGTFGYDVSQVVSAGLYNVANNEKRTVAFAFVVGDNLTDLSKNARQAKNTFRKNNTSGLPLIADQNICKGDTVDISLAPSNGSKFNFYTTNTSKTPLYAGATFTLPGVFENDTLYVRGNDSIFESAPVQVKVLMHADIAASFDYSPQTVDLSVSNIANLLSTSHYAASTSWDMGDGTIYNNTATVTHHYTTTGTYKILLTAKDSYNCMDTVSHLIKVIDPTGVSTATSQDGILIYPNPANDHLNIQFDLSNSQNVSIKIYNTMGQIITSLDDENIVSKNYFIPMSGHDKGMYYAKIDFGGRVVTKKFTVE